MTDRWDADRPRPPDVDRDPGRNGGSSTDLDPGWGEAHQQQWSEPRSTETSWPDASWGDPAWAEGAWNDDAWSEPGWTEPGWDQPRQEAEAALAPVEPAWPEADPTWAPVTPVGPDAWDEFDAIASFPVEPETPEATVGPGAEPPFEFEARAEAIAVEAAPSVPPPVIQPPVPEPATAPPDAPMPPPEMAPSATTPNEPMPLPDMASPAMTQPDEPLPARAPVWEPDDEDFQTLEPEPEPAPVELAEADPVAAEVEPEPVVDTVAPITEPPRAPEAAPAVEPERRGLFRQLRSLRQAQPEPQPEPEPPSEAEPAKPSVEPPAEVGQAEASEAVREVELAELEREPEPEPEWEAGLRPEPERIAAFLPPLLDEPKPSAGERPFAEARRLFEPERAEPERPEAEPLEPEPRPEPVPLFPRGALAAPSPVDVAIPDAWPQSPPEPKAETWPQAQPEPEAETWPQAQPEPEAVDTWRPAEPWRIREPEPWRPSEPWIPERWREPERAAPEPEPVEAAPDAVEAAPHAVEAAPPAEAAPLAPEPWAVPVGDVPPEARPAESLDPVTSAIRTRLAQEDEDWDPSLEAERATTAEAAVPWLIGIVLLLAGMVIVLLALIFTSEGGLPLLGDLPGQNAAAATSEPTSTPEATPEPTSSPDATAAAAPEVSATPEASPTPTPGPVYGALEMVYLGRSAALAPIYLLRKDFTDAGDPAVMAQDPNQDVQSFVLSPDGTRGAAIVAGLLLSIEPGAEKRQLATGISAMTFAPDGNTIYAVQIESSGDTTNANILAVDWLSSESITLASTSYPRPQIAEEGPLREAQFVDNGGLVRLYWLTNGTLLLWVLGAPAQQIDPADGTVTEAENSDPPQLWSPDGEREIRILEIGTRSSLRLVDRDGRELGMTSFDGLVSHLRWAPDSSQVVFTGGGSVDGGVVQDLYMWNLHAGEDPARLTNTGAGFGAEWLGAPQFWEP